MRSSDEQWKEVKGMKEMDVETLLLGDFCRAGTCEDRGRRNRRFG